MPCRIIMRSQPASHHLLSLKVYVIFTENKYLQQNLNIPICKSFSFFVCHVIFTEKINMYLQKNLNIHSCKSFSLCHFHGKNKYLQKNLNTHICQSFSFPVIIQSHFIYTYGYRMKSSDGRDENYRSFALILHMRYHGFGQ